MNNGIGVGWEAAAKALRWRFRGPRFAGLHNSIATYVLVLCQFSVDRRGDSI
jgi:hypothetical protein